MMVYHIISLKNIAAWLVVMMFVASAGVTTASQQEMTKSHVERNIKEAVTAAKQQVEERNYLDALQQLYDVRQQEISYHWTIAWEEIHAIAEFLLEKDVSPLMQYLRNPQISIYERMETLSQITARATGTRLVEQAQSFQKQFNGPLMEIVLDPRLSREAKLDFLEIIRYEIQKYITDEQKTQMTQDMNRLQKKAGDAYQQKNYTEAFHLFGEALAIQGMASFGVEGEELNMQFIDYCWHFARLDSPLIQLLRNPQVDDAEKIAILAELKAFAQQQSFEETPVRFRGIYSDPLIQVLGSPKLPLTLKLDILSFVVEIVEKKLAE